MGDLAGARSTAAGIADGPAKALAYRDIVEIQVETGDTQGAKTTAATIADDDERAWAYEMIGKAQANAGDIAGAKTTVAGVADEGKKKYVYGVIAKVQAKAAQESVDLDWIDKLDNPSCRARACLGAAQGLIEKAQAEGE